PTGPAPPGGDRSPRTGGWPPGPRAGGWERSSRPVLQRAHVHRVLLERLDRGDRGGELVDRREQRDVRDRRGGADLVSVRALLAAAGHVHDEVEGTGGD